MEDILEKHRKIWKDKWILRDIYHNWYKMIISDIKISDKKTLELGSGIGNFKDFYSDVITSDIEKHDWLDMHFDAHQIPFKDNELANIILIDVLHHLEDPVAFFEEALRVLEKEGRIIMLEPYPSFISSIVYKLFHPEPFVYNMDYFNFSKISKKKPWDANQAIPYLLFYKHLNKWRKIMGKRIKILKKERLSFILYPLSGGFENRSIIPKYMVKTFCIIEKLIKPFSLFFAFRCYIVLEKK